MKIGPLGVTASISAIIFAWSALIFLGRIFSSNRNRSMRSRSSARRASTESFSSSAVRSCAFAISALASAMLACACPRSALAFAVSDSSPAIRSRDSASSRLNAVSLTSAEIYIRNAATTPTTRLPINETFAQKDTKSASATDIAVPMITFYLFPDSAVVVAAPDPHNSFHPCQRVRRRCRPFLVRKEVTSRSACPTPGSP